MRILGIETSCDDTGVCLIEAAGDFGFASAKHGAKAGCAFSFKILGNALSSQTALGEQYGGVFPAMAKREMKKSYECPIRYWNVLPKRSVITLDSRYMTHRS